MLDGDRRARHGQRCVLVVLAYNMITVLFGVVPLFWGFVSPMQNATLLN